MMVPVNGKPFPAAGIEPDAAAFNFNANVPEVRVADDEVSFAVFRLFFLSAQDPPYLEEDNKVARKPVPERPIDLRLCLGWQFRQLGVR